MSYGNIMDDDWIHSQAWQADEEELLADWAQYELEIFGLLELADEKALKDKGTDIK